MGKRYDIGRYELRIHHGDYDARGLLLTTRKPSIIPLDALSSLWGNKPDAKERLGLFLLYNKPSFSFLSIDARLVEDGSSAVIFQPAEKVGCAPIFSPVTGKVCASVIVEGNLGEDISEVLPLIEGNIEITFSDSLPLPFKLSIKPPIYFECAKYIDQYIRAQRLHWKRFISEVKIEHTPASSTLWTEYALKSYDPSKTLKYPNRKNLLSTNHTEWRELNYVLKLCLDELSGSYTPRISRLAYREKVEDLRRNVNLKNITKPTELKTRSADPLEIKTLKQIGNRIINSISSEFKAWSVDFSQLFERYVQYVFQLVTARVGGRSFCNNKFAVSGSQRSWTLSYLEPDILIRKEDRIIVADAKYKMHMMNSRAESAASLKESFRHDLHQVLAYSSFERDVNKISMLVYPSRHFSYLHQLIHSSIQATTCEVYIIGIPWGACMDGDTSLSIDQKVSAAVDGIATIIQQSESS